jgi:hypothetical protein
MLDSSNPYVSQLAVGRTPAGAKTRAPNAQE